MGLPSPARFPRAAVERRDDDIAIEFTGPGGSQAMEIPLSGLDEGADPESEELRLLARLQELGYEVERQQPVLENDA